LRKEVGLDSAILDIGSGDAYYVSDLRPRTYAAVEPNLLLRAQTRLTALAVKVNVSMYSTIPALLTSTAIENSEIILMIHVLLYLAPDEAFNLLSRVRATGKKLLIVHPAPERSVSVMFEREYGLHRSVNLLKLKSAILGPPRSQTCVRSHFVLPSDFSNADLAFLVSHHVLEGTLDDDILAAAEEFVRVHRTEWQAGPHLKLPQSQILEVYGPS
jgi:hypothetical protein